MKMNFTQMEALYNAINTLKDTKMSFKLSLILAKNLQLIEKEREFYLDKEREFATTYLEMNNETGRFVESAPGVYKIVDGKEAECREARMALDTFETEIELRMIPQSLVENMEFTPAELAALECIIEEG